ncbi:MAG TPA: NAD(P)H-quinone oxidoreductase [Polyangiaceae bacterium]|nr:NAD(P)H-quinone oxidoreductase [Polyangiaceae bacterium]
MRAVTFDQPGAPSVLTLRDVPDPHLGVGEVLIDVHAAALNRADLLQRRGLYPPPAGASEILGLECAGVVAALGPGTSAAARGDAVMALLPGGGYAEKVVVHERLTLPVPEGLGWAEAAAIPEAFLTAQEALVSLGRLAPGDTALIHAAAGGVGSAAVQLARVLGARVVATAGSDEKVDFVGKLGATAINYQREDFEARLLELTAQHGADVIIDFIGASYAEKHARCLAVGGRHVVVGLLGGTKATVDFGRLLSRRQALLGLVMRTRPLADKIAIVEAFRRHFLGLFRDGRLRPLVDSVVPLAEVARAHERMEANQNLGKIVLEIRPG